MLTVNNLFRSTKHCRSDLTNYVTVRWKTKPKKPFYLGLAKSKLFRIPERKLDPQDQYEEGQRLTKIYERQMKAILNFMMTHVDHQFLEEKKLDVSDKIKESMKLHDSWNAECARLREERLEAEDKMKTERILNELIQHQEKTKELQAKVEELVRTEIENSATFITAENVDEAIEKCLASVSDYNYAIDLSGKIYKGEGEGSSSELPIEIEEKEMTL